MMSAALLGLAVSLYNYLAPLSGIDGTPGAILVIASTTILALLGCLLLGATHRGWRAFLLFGSFTDIAGTAFAGYLLESQALIVLMAAALIGWVAILFRRRSPT